MNQKFEKYTYPVDDANWEAIATGIPYGSETGFLSAKFSGHTYPPSRRVWNDINAVLRPSSRRRPAAWWVAAAASVLFLAALTYVKMNTIEPAPHLTQQTEKTNPKPKTKKAGKSAEVSAQPVEKDKDQRETGSAVEKPGSAGRQPANKTKSYKANKPIPTPISAEYTETFAARQNPGANRAKSEIAPKINTKMNAAAVANNQGFAPRHIPIIGTEIKVADSQKSLLKTPTNPELAAAPTEVKNKKSSPFFDGTESSKSKEFSVLAGSQLAFAGNGNSDATYYTSADESLTASPNSGFTTDIATTPQNFTFSTPVYYGVNAEFEFWNRFAAGTGLGYLQMEKTTESYAVPTTKFVRDFENRYISLPIYLKFNFIHKPKFSAYTTLGNAFDILIWQKTTTKRYESETLIDTNTGSTENGNQANIYTGVGMRFNFTKHIGLYTEGSLMRYYYSSNDNFYSQQNLWPGLRFGAVVSF